MSTLIEQPMQNDQLRRKAQEISRILAERLLVEMTPTEVYARLPDKWQGMSDAVLVWRLTGMDLKIDADVIQDINPTK